MTESTASAPLTTEQLAGTEAGVVAPPSMDPVPPGTGATRANTAWPNEHASSDVAIQGRPSGSATAKESPLLANNADFIARWTAIQTTFVDEPRMAVEQADTLVAEVIRELARVFAEERSRLEGAWSQGTDVSTEDLRQALQRYRDFFQTLLRN
jgi:capsid protein